MNIHKLHNQYEYSYAFLQKYQYIWLLPLGVLLDYDPVLLLGRKGKAFFFFFYSLYSLAHSVFSAYISQ